MDNLTQMMLSGTATIDDCWKEANQHTLPMLNEGIDKEDGTPHFSFDCGFKLDFDGALISVNSRFYRPGKDERWNGNLTVYFMGNEMFEKYFDAVSLDVLRDEVLLYLGELNKKIGAFIETIKP